VLPDELFWCCPFSRRVQTIWTFFL